MVTIGEFKEEEGMVVLYSMFNHCKSHDILRGTDRNYTIMVEEEGVEHTTKRGVVEIDEVDVVTIKIAPPPNNSIGEPKISDCEI